MGLFGNSSKQADVARQARIDADRDRQSRKAAEESRRAADRERYEARKAETLAWCRSRGYNG